MTIIRPATGDAVTAVWGQSVADALNADGLWQDYVPVWTQGATITKQAGFVGRYTLIGKTVIGEVMMLSGSAGTPGGTIAASSPLPIKGAAQALGSGLLLQPPHLPLIVYPSAAGWFAFVAAYDSSSGFFGSNPAVTIVSGMTLTFAFHYETT